MTATERFVRHALGTSYAELPPSVIQAAKIFTLDTIGVGVAGAAAPYVDLIVDAATGWGADGASSSASVLGRSLELPAPSAAFVNGFQIHCQEYDCVHEPAVVHPMATVFAALSAEAQRSGPVNGREFLTAIVLAIDIAAGLGVAAKSGIKFFRPATAGIFGATLGAARLRRLNQAQALDALGYALAFCSGAMQAHVEGKPALPVQIGNAARGALMACDLAAAGLPGPNDVIDGPFGYLSLFEDESDIAPVIDGLGKVWRVTEVSHKPFPTGRAAQGGIVAIQRLRETGVTADALDCLTLTAPPLIHRLVGRPYKDEMSANYARLCFAYAGAVALINGTVGLEDFTASRISDAVIADVARRISVIDDNSPDPAAFTPQVARAVLKDGRIVEATVNALYGSPQEPMSNDAHLEKFRCCMDYGFGRPAGVRSDELIARVEHIEDESDVRALLRLASGS